MPTIRFEPRGTAIEVPQGTRLIDAIRAAGLPIARACGDDLICALCGVHVLEGRVTRESRSERRSKERNRIPPELRLACALRVHDDLVVTASYWGERADAR
ncbi:MAG: 2Fe-2S iron-sulfur cluster-binding protein [Myxococcota bacterium]